MNARIIKFTFSVVSLLILVLFSGCTHVLIPVEGPVYRGEDLALKDLKVEVIPGQYYVQFDRDDMYLPVHVIIRNHTRKPVKVSQNNFLMLDDVGNKFRAAGIKEVMDYYRIVTFSVFPYYHHYGWYYRYYRPVSWYHPHSRVYTLELIRNTFLNRQRLMPGESTAGFVYFHRAATFADEKVTLVAKFVENNRKPVEYVFVID